MVLLRSCAAVGLMDTTKPDRYHSLRDSGAVALLEFLLAAARARIVAANVLQGVAHRLLVAVVAVRAMHVAVVVMMVMIVVVVAVRTVNVGLLAHCGLLREKIAGDYLTTALQVQVAGEE